jgi:membrane-bound serine protease (ClpP class)
LTLWWARLPVQRLIGSLIRAAGDAGCCSYPATARSVGQADKEARMVFGSRWQNDGSDGRPGRLGAVLLAILLALIGTLSTASSADREASVHIVRVNGAIGVGTGVMFREALAAAAQAKARLVVVEIDTPGGLVAATREIIKDILASPVPVAVFVSPSGARAASAGTYIAYAAHVVAMAPGTHLGAATPVQMSFPGMPQRPNQPAPQPAPQPADKSKPADGKSDMERKVLNDAVAYLRSLAQLRGRSDRGRS